MKKDLDSKKGFLQKDTVSMARELLGKLLVINTENTVLAGYITETEAYLGAKDRACHSYGNKRTKKNEAMFEKAGTVYIYTIHTHKMLNIVSCGENNPQAVLIRAVEPAFQLRKMEENRDKKGISVSNGPGKLTEAMKIDDRLNKTQIKFIEENMIKSSNGSDFFYDASKINEKYLYIDLENSRIPKRIENSPRIGIPNKGIWTGRKLRFFVSGNKFVSGMRKSEFKEDVWE